MTDQYQGNIARGKLWGPKAGSACTVWQGPHDSRPARITRVSWYRDTMDVVALYTDGDGGAFNIGMCPHNRPPAERTGEQCFTVATDDLTGIKHDPDL